MRELSLKAGMNEKHYDNSVKNLTKITDECLEKIYLCVLSIYNNEYTELVKIRSAMHITEEMWDNYKKLGIKDLAEQVIFNKLANKLKMAWSKFPKKEWKHDKNRYKKKSS